MLLADRSGRSGSARRTAASICRARRRCRLRCVRNFVQVAESHGFLRDLGQSRLLPSDRILTRSVTAPRRLSSATEDSGRTDDRQSPRPHRLPRHGGREGLDRLQRPSEHGLLQRASSTAVRTRPSRSWAWARPMRTSASSPSTRRKPMSATCANCTSADKVTVTFHLIDHDEKRLRAYQEIRHADGWLAGDLENALAPYRHERAEGRALPARRDGRRSRRSARRMQRCPRRSAPAARSASGGSPDRQSRKRKPRGGRGALAVQSDQLKR